MTQINLKPELAGYFKFEAVNAETGERRVVADWFPNLITNQGLNRMGNANVLAGCMVGTSNSTPNVNNNQLGNMLAYTDLITTATNSARSTAPYYGYRRATYRFSPGEATGNLSEVSIGWREWDSINSKYKYFSFSRALILDSLGNPTTITILANEYLDITYELRLYPPLDDAYYQVALEGVTYDVIVRAAYVTTAGSPGWAPTLGPVSWWSYSTMYTGSLGPITGSPSGDSSGIISQTGVPYVNNSLTSRCYINAGLDDANFSGGVVKSILYYTNNMGIWQLEFFPGVPKDITKTLRALVGVSWGRR